MREKKEFNFAQRWIDELSRENQSPSVLKSQVFTWIIGSLLLLGVVGSTPWLWEYKVRRDIRLVEDKISNLREIANQVNEMKALKTKAEGQEQLQSLMQNSTHDPAPILDKLKSILPVGSIVNSFSLQENTVTLSISVPTPVDVARLWTSLRDSGMFQMVDMPTVLLQDQAQTLNFNLTLK